MDYYLSKKIYMKIYLNFLNSLKFTTNFRIIYMIVTKFA